MYTFSNTFVCLFLVHLISLFIYRGSKFSFFPWYIYDQKLLEAIEFEEYQATFEVFCMRMVVMIENAT